MFAKGVKMLEFLINLVSYGNIYGSDSIITGQIANFVIKELGTKGFYSKVTIDEKKFYQNLKNSTT